MPKPHSARASRLALSAAVLAAVALGPAAVRVAAGEPVIRVNPAASGEPVPFAPVATEPPPTTAPTTTTTVPPGSVHVCPVPTSAFIDSWGFARSGGRRHQGVDMMARHGDAVLAPVDGVVETNRSGLGGLSFHLAGLDGNMYYGAHLATLDVTGPVTAGQPIGTVGTSGNASSPHLHFEVHPGDGAAVNPYPYVAEWCRPVVEVPVTAWVVRV